MKLSDFSQQVRTRFCDLFIDYCKKHNIKVLEILEDASEGIKFKIYIHDLYWDFCVAGNYTKFTLWPCAHFDKRTISRSFEEFFNDLYDVSQDPDLQPARNENQIKNNNPDFATLGLFS